MSDISFNVSARTALLIGRENIANAKGAIIELVKNCYDADADYAILIIDNRLASVPEVIKESLYKRIVESDDEIKKEILDKIYRKKDNLYVLETERLSHEERVDLFVSFVSRLKSLSAIYLIDNGTGMTAEIIKDNWMTIGTANKLSDAITKSKKRVRSGAKGIGRFALDKLGSQCSLISLNKKASDNFTHSVKNQEGVFWSVDWTQFEQPNITIDKVKANLESVNESSLGNLISKLKSSSGYQNFNLETVLDKVDQLASTQYKWKGNKDISHGTIIKISDLHEIWDNDAVKNLFKDLEVLVPPSEIHDFSIHILSALNPTNYGEVLSSYCDDFDYKITAKANEDQIVEITIEREEYDINIIPNDFFERKPIKESPFANKEQFFKKVFNKKYTFNELLGSKINPKILEQIGRFDFIFYYLKKTTSSDVTEKFFYKSFNSNERKNWLDQFAGIKLYRDGFRVRPYGEIKESSFDWLGLGPRKASNPAGVAKKEGGYKVEVENISGVVKISRLTNLNFEDKSSREGLQESETFQVFKNLLLEIISKFEDDRSFIASEMKKYDDEKYGPERDLEKARKLAQDIIRRQREERRNDENTSTSSNNLSTTHKNPETELLAALTDSLLEENEKLKEEQKLMRAMASSGIVSAALGHDLEKIQYKLKSRADDLLENLEPFLNKAEMKNLEDYKNPIIAIQKIKQVDYKILTWLGFSLGFTRKDKRKRKLLDLEHFFDQIQENWQSTLYERGIALSISIDTAISLRAFEIDFDSIFINLLTNSIDAFSLPSNRKESRKISIEIKEKNQQIQITYKDNGPGLPKSLIDPYSIFKPMFTTKRDHNGQEIGTGLGMWIVKTVIDEYSGKINLLNNGNSPEIEEGFGIRFSIPIQYKAKSEEN